MSTNNNSSNNNSSNNNKRWDTDEKIKLMKAFSEGKSYDEIGKILNRSANAIKLRLESIVYDNLINGKPMSVLTRMLHTDADTIKQLYYSHKSFLQARGEQVVDVDFSKNTETVENQKVLSMPQPQPQPQPQQTQTISSPLSQNITSFASRDNLMQGRPISGGNGNPVSDSNGSKLGRKLEKLEKENYAMEQIIKNYKMKRQLRKLYVSDKLDEKSALICDRILKQTGSMNT